MIINPDRGDILISVELQMTTCAAAPPSAITSGIWHRRHSVSFPTKTPAVFQIEKDAGFRAPKLHTSGEISMQPVVANAENCTSVDGQIPDMKENAHLPSIFVSNRVSQPRAKLSRKGKNTKRGGRNSATQTENAHNYFPAIKYPLMTESAMKAIFECNTLVFAVEKRANKTEIKSTVEKMFHIRAKKVNTLITYDGTKKAFVMLGPDFSALDVAKRIKML